MADWRSFSLPRRAWTSWVLLASFATLLWIHSDLILTDPLLQRDDLHILEGRKDLSTWLHYLREFRFREILVYQPVRDFSLFLDLELQRFAGFGSFHLTNVLIWFAIVVTVWRLLEFISPRHFLNLPLITLFSVHPVFVNSIAWVSARKHLLACLFICLATLNWLKARHAGRPRRLLDLSSGFFYLLSILSHPITVLWPAWASFYALQDRGEKRNRSLVLMCSLLLMAVVVLANLIYYTEEYVSHTAAQKLMSDSPIGISLLAHGRYLMNLLFPFRIATVYSPASALNIAGVLIGLAGVAWVLLRTSRRATLPWLVFYLFPLLPVTLRMTNVFVSDTYVLTSAAGLLCLLMTALRDKFPTAANPQLLVRAIPALTVVLALLLTLHSSRLAGAWRTDADLWASAWRTEPSVRSLEMHVHYLILQGRADEAVPLALRLKAWDPHSLNSDLLLGKAVYLDPSIGITGKIELLSRALEQSDGRQDPWLHYYLALLHAEDGQAQKASLFLDIALKEGEAFGEDRARLEALSVQLKERSALPEPGKSK